MGVANPQQKQSDKFKGSGVSLPTSLAPTAKARAKDLGFTSFSAYVVALIHCDLATPGGWLHIPSKKPKS